MSDLFIRRLTRLMATTALVTLPLTTAAQSDCDGTRTDCEGDITIQMPVGANTERSADVPELGSDGFDIAIDGAPVAEDGTIAAGPLQREARQRRQDLALEAANVQVKFDGLDVQPRLVLGATRVPSPGEAVELVNRMNYPAFVTRGELRVVEVDRWGRGRLIEARALAPNGQITVRAAQPGVTRYYSYRVYDAQGRYDETQPLALTDLMGRTAPLIPQIAGEPVEEGTDTTAGSRIPVYGGAVTVTGTGLAPGQRARTLGENLRADDGGTFVMQRILPPGDHLVNVSVSGREALTRDINIPTHDLFYVGIVDLTVGRTLDDDLRDASGTPYDKTFKRGRVAFYLKGKVRGDMLLTAAMDTGEDDLDNLLSNLDEKNPRSVLDRIDPDEYYPVYGDDSSAFNDAPTAGRFYIRLERDDSHVVWGTFKSSITGTEYLRNERTLYGAQAVHRSQAQTTRGEARVEAEVFAAQPDTLPQRDVFRGTGGSVYFLRFQDISRGSETLQIEVQDPDTGRVISRRTLVYGTDYDLNYLQGLVTLRAPLSGTAVDGDVIEGNPSGDNAVFLVATYEHTPTISDVDSFSYGGRVQGWVADNLRIGVTAQREDLGTTDQDAYGVDLLYRHSDRTYLSLEYARTDGTGVDQTISVDGGLTGGTQVGVAGEGRAVKLEAQADLQELGLGTPGLVGFYFEDRSAGFSTLSYRSANDETLYGVFLEAQPSDLWSVRLDLDHFEDSAGKRLTEGSVAASYAYSDRIGLTFGIEHIDEVTPGVPAETGSRTDIAARVDVAHSDRLAWYVFGQGTVSRSGQLSRNNRLGFGAEYEFANNWTGAFEVSDGTLGVGAQVRVSHTDDVGNATYFGYALDPGRELDGLTRTGSDKGRLVAGATRRVTEQLTFTGENSYDLFGQRRALTSIYGANYAVTERLTFDGSVERGRVRDTIADTDFDRTALSFGAQYQSEWLTWRGRIELRRDEGITTGSNSDAETIAGSFSSRYKISEDARLLFAMEGIQSDNANTSIPDAEYGELTFGYAFRPTENDRLNVLAKYQFIYDMTERATTTGPLGDNFLETPRQRAHILTLDASYDLNERWTLGGKIGGRWSEQDSGAGFVSNDATLGVVNLRYHAIHRWDFLLEARQLASEDVGTQVGVLAAAYRHFGNNLKVGVGYNAGRFSDDLADVTYNDRGVFLNVVGKF